MYLLSQASLDCAGGGSPVPGDMEVSGRGLARRVVRAAVSLWDPDAASSSYAAIGRPGAAVCQRYHHRRRRQENGVTLAHCKVSINPY